MTSRPDQAAVRTVPGGIELTLHVLPRAACSGYVGLQDAALKIKITKPPVDGKANAECCAVLAKLLGVPKSRVQLVRGATARRKVVRVTGVCRDHALQVFGLGGHGPDEVGHGG